MTKTVKFKTLLLTTIAAVAVFAFVTACTQEQAKAKPNIVIKDAPKAGVVAKIAGEEITLESLIADDKLDYFELKKREHDFLYERALKLAEEKLIGAEAKKAGITLQEFITKNVTKGEIKIADTDFKNFVKEKHISENQINPQIKERITQYLQNQKRQTAVTQYVAKLSKDNPIEIYFRKPKLEMNVEVGQAPAFGKKDAKVKIIVFSDFQCPFCGRAAETVSEVKKKFGNKTQVAFKHFPLPMHKDAKPASEASMCVNEQSSDKFWKFHDLAFKNQDKLNSEGLEKLAKDSGADVAKFKECMGAKKFADFVKTDLEYGEKIGVRSTPTFFINGQLIAGAVPFEQFAETINEALAEADAK